jgi:hypothetical protein
MTQTAAHAEKPDVVPIDNSVVSKVVTQEHTTGGSRALFFIAHVVPLPLLTLIAPLFRPHEEFFQLTFG